MFSQTWKYNPITQCCLCLQLVVTIFLQDSLISEPCIWWKVCSHPSLATLILSIWHIIHHRVFFNCTRNVPKTTMSSCHYIICTLQICFHDDILTKAEVEIIQIVNDGRTFICYIWIRNTGKNYICTYSCLLEACWIIHSLDNWIVFYQMILIKVMLVNSYNFCPTDGQLLN